MSSFKLGTLGQAPYQATLSADDGNGWQLKGKGDAALKKALEEAGKNSSDDIVVMVGSDVYAATSSALKTVFPKNPQYGNYDTVRFTNKEGEVLEGVVKGGDRDASSARERKKAEEQQKIDRKKYTPAFLATSSVFVASLITGAKLADRGANGPLVLLNVVVSLASGLAGYIFLTKVDSRFKS